LARTPLLQRSSNMSEIVLAPQFLTEQLSRRALEIAQVIGPRNTGRGLNSLIPIAQTGIVGLTLPDETAYLFDLEKGVTAHAMVDLAGRVIPIRNPDGTISFRRASQNKIGKIPIITRTSITGKLYTGDPEWEYPKKDGLHFMKKSIQMSVDEWKRTATSKDIFDMLMKTEVGDDVSQIIYGRSVI